MLSRNIIEIKFKIPKNEPSTMNYINCLNEIRGPVVILVKFN